MRATNFFLTLISALLLVTPVALAANLIITDPVSATVNGVQVIDLGVVGPGQKLELIAERNTGEDAKGLTYKNEALWDRLVVVPESLPPGWSNEDSKWYESPMHLFVTVDKNTADGLYTFSARTIDEYEGARPLTVIFSVQVSRELLELEVVEKNSLVGVEQPAVYIFILRNKSSASDVFEVTQSGLPNAKPVVKKIQVPHNSQEAVSFELLQKEQGDYSVSFTATSLSSPLISASTSDVLSVKSTLWNDMRAVSHGMLLFPSAQQAAYAVMGLIASILS